MKTRLKEEYGNRLSFLLKRVSKKLPEDANERLISSGHSDKAIKLAYGVLSGAIPVDAVPSSVAPRVLDVLVSLTTMDSRMDSMAESKKSTKKVITKTKSPSKNKISEATLRKMIRKIILHEMAEKKNRIK